jgi:hypothetical protein
MNLNDLADELLRQEFARLKDAQTPRIEAFCSMTRGGLFDEIASMMERLNHELIAVSPDILTVKDGRKYLTHCANPADLAPVRMPAVRRLHEAVVAASAFKGIYVTPRSFTPEAEHYAGHAPITLVDGRLLIKSMHLSRKAVLLPQRYKAMCWQCGDIVQHSLAKDDQARPCINGHLVAPTISRAALIPYRPPPAAAGQQPVISAATFSFAMHPAGPHPKGSGPVIKPRIMTAAPAGDQSTQSQAPGAHDPAPADTERVRMKPPALAGGVIVLDPHRGDRADACEAVNHDTDQRAIAQADERRGIDAFEQAPGLLFSEHRGLAPAHDVFRPAHRMCRGEPGAG